MTSIAIHFMMCNLFIALCILMITAVKHLFKNYLSAQVIYRLWYVLFVFMALPFIPVRLPEIFRVTARMPDFQALPAAPGQGNGTVQKIMDTSQEWMNDFTVSVSKKAPATLGTLCLVIWLTGIFFMLIIHLKAHRKLFLMKQSAIRIEDPSLRKLYDQCCAELGITKKPELFRTSILKSPVMTGIIRPSIYLPAHLLCDMRQSHGPSFPALRHMLLHELVHYKQKDALTNGLINLFHLLYWSNPVVWFAVNEMRNDREIACDTAVLKVLGEKNAFDYGNTLINLAEKISMDIFPSVSGMSGNMRQMTQRIRHIAAYRRPTRTMVIKSACIGLATAALLLSLSPTLAANALYHDLASAHGGRISSDSRDIDQPSSLFAENTAIADIDLSSYFKDIDGSFVLYDLSADSWQIYNKADAFTRKSPDSTYKIYAALFALDAGLITPESSEMTWDGEIRTFDAWNKNQDLNSAMENSVNWYFQTLEEQMGKAVVQQYIDEISYGNRNLNGDFPSCWLESSLKISPAEQVSLLKEIFSGQSSEEDTTIQHTFSDAHIQTVKNALCLYNIPGGAIYGKTGTGNINDHNVNGWFVGFTESYGRTCFFATHIEGSDDVSGSRAAEITQAILSDLGILH